VRLLPPLIIGDDEIAEATARIARACERISNAHAGASREPVV